MNFLQLFILCDFIDMYCYYLILTMEEERSTKKMPFMRS